MDQHQQQQKHHQQEQQVIAFLQNLFFVTIDPIVRPLRTIIQEQLPVEQLAEGGGAGAGAGDVVVVPNNNNNNDKMSNIKDRTTSTGSRGCSDDDSSSCNSRSLMPTLLKMTKLLEELHQTIHSFIVCGSTCSTDSNNRKDPSDDNNASTSNNNNQNGSSASTSNNTKQQKQLQKQVQLLLDMIRIVPSQQQREDEETERMCTITTRMIICTAILPCFDYIMISIISLLLLLGRSSRNGNDDRRHCPLLLQLWCTTPSSLLVLQQQQRQDQIVQSYVWKSCTLACTILSELVHNFYVVASTQQQTEEENGTPPIRATTMISLVGMNDIENNNKKQDNDFYYYKRLISYMNACLLVLPTGPMIRQHFFHEDKDTTTTTTSTSQQHQEQKQQHDKGTDKSSSSSNSNSNSNTNSNSSTIVISSQLESNGEQCLFTILTTLQSIIHAILVLPQQSSPPPSSSHSKHHNDSTHYAIPYTFILRILDTCLAIIEPSNATAINFPNRKEAISYHVQLSAMEIIQTILQSSISLYQQQQRQPINTPRTTTQSKSKTVPINHIISDHHFFDWTSVFPGIYTSIYRRVLHMIQLQSQQQPSFNGSSHFSNTSNNNSRHAQEQMIYLGLQIIANLMYHCCCNVNNSQHSMLSDDKMASSSSSSVSREIQSPQQKSSATVLQRLQALALTATTSTTPGSSIDSPPNSGMKGTPSLKADNEFIVQIQQRLPSTLIVLLNAISRKEKLLQRSKKIRNQLTQLNRTILIDTEYCWINEEYDMLLITSFESLLLLLLNNGDIDNDDDGRASTISVIREFIQFHNNSTIQSRVLSKMGIRVTELLERLPSYLQSVREHEMYVSIQLIGSYIKFLPQKEMIRPLLLLDTTQSTIRRVMIQLLDVQFEIRDPDHSGRIVLSFLPNQHDTARTTSHPFPNTSKRQYTSESLAQHTKELIQMYGAAIGQKHVSILIDNYVADLYRSCINRFDTFTTSGRERGQIQWIHEWIGILPLIQHLLIGGFTSTTKLDIQQQNKANKKYYERFLIPLFNSVIPILTTYPLWDLSNHLATDTSSPTSETLTASVLRGNVSITCFILDFITSAMDLLHLTGDDANIQGPSTMQTQHMQQLNVILLYPIIDKMGEHNAGAVREAAYQALQALTKANRYTDCITVIAHNIESCLIEPMLRRLRVPGGRSLQPDTPIDYDVACVLQSATTVIRIAMEESGKCARINTNINPSFKHPIGETPVLLSSIQNLVTQLTKRFDLASTIMTYDLPTCLQYVQLFDATISLMQIIYSKPNCDEGDTFGSTNCSSCPQQDKEDTEPWFRLLDPYKKNVTDDDNLTPKEGFEKHWKDKEKRMSRNDMTKNGLPLNAEIRSDISYQCDLQFCSYVLWRCGYLLSHPTLQIQLRTCDVFVKCFQWFGCVTANHSFFNSAISSTSSNARDNDGTTTNTSQKPETAILRQIHSSWPSISGRLKALSISVAQREKKSSIQPLSSMLLIGESKALPKTQRGLTTNLNNIGQQRLFLCKLLHLVTVMIEHSGDFMTSRLRGELFPQCILPLLRYYSHESGDLHRNISLHIANMKESSNQELLHALFCCIRRIFQYRPMGTTLVNLIPTIGQSVIAIIFPATPLRLSLNVQLPHEERILLVGLDVLRCMIKLDADILYRPISKLLFQSGSENGHIQLLPPRHPILPAGAGIVGMSFLQQQVHDLFHLILTLPEQPLY